jgi:hypothetical protein
VKNPGIAFIVIALFINALFSMQAAGGSVKRTPAGSLEFFRRILYKTTLRKPEFPIPVAQQKGCFRAFLNSSCYVKR